MPINPCIASVLGLPYEKIADDLSGVNYLMAFPLLRKKRPYKLYRMSFNPIHIEVLGMADLTILQAVRMNARIDDIFTRWYPDREFDCVAFGREEENPLQLCAGSESC